MGREIRRVPLDWQHPKDESGQYVPMFDESYDDAFESYAVDHLPDEDPPDRSRFRPEWAPDAVLGYQVYEDTTEGTPVSPVFETIDALVDWLSDPEGVELGVGGRTIVLSRKQATRFVEEQHSVTLVTIGGRIMSGLEAL